MSHILFRAPAFINHNIDGFTPVYECLVARAVGKSCDCASLIRTDLLDPRGGRSDLAHTLVGSGTDLRQTAADRCNVEAALLARLIGPACICFGQCTQ